MWKLWRLLLAMQLVAVRCWFTAAQPVSPPTTIGIGSLLAFNSTIGRAVRPSLELAMRDINNSTLLGNSQLVLHLGNTNCSAFQGAAAAANSLKEEVVAIMGPQTSVVSHFVSHMATATQVPLVSFSATDPSLSEEQYFYFVRVTHSDDIQMQAIAGIIQHYGWREVTALYIDDDFGNNGINSLLDALQAMGPNTVHKANLSPTITPDEMSSELTKLSEMESRVFVVHVEPKLGRNLFIMAQRLQMMSQGYVWIVTEAMTSVMNDLGTDPAFSQALQGVLGTRSHIPGSTLLQGYKDRWVEMHGNDSTLGPAQMNNVYAWYAYDALWTVAYGIRKFLDAGGEITFVDPPVYPGDAGGESELAGLRVFRDGKLMLDSILEHQFTGITGPVQLDERNDLMGSSFDIVNMVGEGLRVVGFWSNATGCLASAPVQNTTSTLNASVSESQLQTVIWPGGGVEVPKGWVVPKIGRPLVIGIPNRVGYKEFVGSSEDSDNRTLFRGFCIDVFQQALANLPYAVSYYFTSYGDGNSTPNYDALVNKIAEREFDAVVGDVTITTKRSMSVDFTQPFTTSGLVVVVPVKQAKGNYAWAFLRPFTPLMWVTTGAFFFFTGLVVWLLEHKKNRDFRGRPKKQVVTTLWFVFMTLFFSQNEKVNSTLGRAVLVIWLFVVLIIISSYTASLTSFLTVQQLLPTIQGIASLVSSNVPIGYQTGSFVRDYLLQLNVAEDRLVALNTLAEYSAALTKGSGRGSVGAIVDELPYVQSFLSSECAFTIAGQEFTKSGWGFAFPKGSQLAIDFSTAILKLAETGELQRIHDLWLNTDTCSTRNVATDSMELGLTTFWGLFLVTGCASLFCCLVYWTRMIIKHRRVFRERKLDETMRQMSRLEASKSFMKSLVTFIEEEETPTRRVRSSRRKKSKDWFSSPEQISPSSSMPKDSKRTSGSPDHNNDDSVSKKLEIQPTIVVSENGTMPSEQIESPAVDATRDLSEEQDSPNPNSTVSQPT